MTAIKHHSNRPPNAAYILGALAVIFGFWYLFMDVYYWSVYDDFEVHSLLLKIRNVIYISKSRSCNWIHYFISISTIFITCIFCLLVALNYTYSNVLPSRKYSICENS